MTVLYEDPDLLVVSKPPGLLFHPSQEPGRANLVETVRASLRERGDDDYLGTHQRLDCDTSGVVLFSRNREVNPALARQFEGRQVIKVYHALVDRSEPLPVPEWSVRDHLARQGNLTVSRPHGQSAHTDFRRLGWNDRVLLLEARPRTGRRHQIRVHLAGVGLPILGDDLYGGTPASRVMLHALRLELRHPRSGEPLVVIAPYPQDFATLADDLEKS